MVTVFLADGFEEIEAITPIDILRRGGVNVRTCSITESKTVTGAHGVSFVADITLDSLSDEEEVILLPGGMPGTANLKACKALCERILKHNEKGGVLAAICAAPTVYGDLGLLTAEVATCYPAMEKELVCKQYSKEKTVVSHQFVTSRGAGTAASLGFRLLSLLKGEETAKKLAEAMCFEGDAI